jgi:hypothetical protein
LFAVLGLVFVLAVSLVSPAAAAEGIRINKVTTNNDSTTVFLIGVSREGSLVFGFDLVGGGGAMSSGSTGAIDPGDYTLQEKVPRGWVLWDISCSALSEENTFDFLPGEGVIVHYRMSEDLVTCTLTNCPLGDCPEEAVGGVVTTANTLALVAPWLAVIGLVACIGTVVVVARKRR